VLSGLPGESLRDLSLKQGACVFLDKSTDMKVIVEQIQKVI